MKRFPLPFIALFVALALASVGVTGGSARAGHETSTGVQKEMEAAFGEFLFGDPEAAVEALQGARQHERAARAEHMRAAIAQNREALLNDPTSPVAGNRNGEVTIVEFFDYHCVYCKLVLPIVIKVMNDDPGVRVVYKEFPILGPDSEAAARAALASLRQDTDKYEAFHTALMSNRGRLKMAKIMQIARDAGYDVDRLKADMKLPEIRATIERNKALARALGINGTPSFVIGDQVVPGAVDLDTLKRLVAGARGS